MAFIHLITFPDNLFSNFHPSLSLRFCSSVENYFSFVFSRISYQPDRKRIALETEKSEKETQLEHNLFRKREQLETEVAEASEQDLQDRLAEAEEELREVNDCCLDLAERFIRPLHIPSLSDTHTHMHIMSIHLFIYHLFSTT